MRRARFEVLLADADFDAEWRHRAVRSHAVGIGRDGYHFFGPVGASSAIAA